MTFRDCSRAAAALLLCGCAEWECLNTPYSDTPSPDGDQHVVVFDHDCHTNAPFSTQVSVLRRSRVASGTGNVLIVADQMRFASIEGSTGPRVVASWLDSRTLELRFDSRVRVTRKRERYNGITIQYAFLNSGSRP